MRAKQLLVVVALTACSAEQSEPALGTYEGAVISDAVHANGAAGFYWLPPMVAAPSPTGMFESRAAPTIEIVRLICGVRREARAVGEHAMQALDARLRAL